MPYVFLQPAKQTVCLGEPVVNFQVFASDEMMQPRQVNCCVCLSSDSPMEICTGRLISWGQVDEEPLSS